eukprot:6488643-Amphidinium_carterae.1
MCDDEDIFKGVCGSQSHRWQLWLTIVHGGGWGGCCGFGLLALVDSGGCSSQTTIHAFMCVAPRARAGSSWPSTPPPPHSPKIGYIGSQWWLFFTDRHICIRICVWIPESEVAALAPCA